MARNPRVQEFAQSLEIDKSKAKPEVLEKLEPLPGEEKEPVAVKKDVDDPPIERIEAKPTGLLENDDQLITLDEERLEERVKSTEKKVPDPVVEKIDTLVPDELLPDELKLNAETPKPAEDEISDDVISKWEPKAQESFKSMRIELKAAKEAIKTAQAGTSDPQANEKLTEAQKALDEAHNTIARLNLAEDPRFKAKYGIQKDMIVGQLKDQAKQLEYDEGIIDLLSRMPLRERLNYISEKAPLLKDVAMPLFTEIDRVDRMMNLELSNAKSSMEQMSALQTEQMKQLQGRIFDTSIEGAVKAGHFVFQKHEDNAEWNSTVDAITEKANKILGSGNAQLQTESILLGQAAPVYLNLFRRERAARVQLQTQLAKYTNASPRITADDSSSDQNAYEVPKRLSTENLAAAFEAKKRAKAAMA